MLSFEGWLILLWRYMKFFKKTFCLLRWSSLWEEQKGARKRLADVPLPLARTVPITAGASCRPTSPSRVPQGGPSAGSTVFRE